MAWIATSPPLRRAPACLVAGRRSFSVSAPKRSRFTAKEAADHLMSQFGGKSDSRRQFIDPNQLQKLAVTLGRPRLGNGGEVDACAAGPLPPGTPVPPGHHLVYFTPGGLEADLGLDGTDRTYNAPSPFTRRMWAGGVMRWPAAERVGTDTPQLLVGDTVEEKTRLLSATPKKSRSAGEMVLVEVEKEFWTPRGLAVVDRRSWVFRPEIDPTIGSSEVPPPLGLSTRGASEIKDADDDTGTPARHFCWSAVGLFRFSALTFNGHKIHINEEWARQVEGHRGLVVHGPLNLINMLDYWRDTHGGGSTPHQVTYRALAPVYAGETYKIATDAVRDTAELRVWDIVVDKSGLACMKGEIIGK